MIKRVRRSFIKITMTMMSLVLLVPLCALNIITAAVTYNQTHQILQQIAQAQVELLAPPVEEENGGKPDLPMEEEAPTVQTTTAPETLSSTETTTTTTRAIASAGAEESPARQTTAPPAQDQNSTESRGEGQQTKLPERTQSTQEEHVFQTKPASQEMPDLGGGQEEMPDGNSSGGNDEGWNWRDHFYPWDTWEGMDALHVGGFSSLSALLTQSKQASSSVTSTTTTTTTTTETVTTTLSQEPPMDMENRRQHINEEMQKDDHLLERKVEGSNSIDHFILLLDDTGTVYDVRGTEDYDTESGQILADTIAASKKNDGYCDSLQYVKLEYEEGAVIVCSDRLSDRTMLKNLLLISIAVFILMEGIVLLLTMVLTKRAMRPVQVSFEKQQQFISDAGHELKTPLTIISANTDILMDEIGENKWLTYIKSQTERMRILVQEMMDLTKLSNNSDTLIRSHFNISSLVENVALPFECQAFEQHKKFDIDTQPDIMFFGNTEQIRRMIGIFIDNAFKYSNENGTIQVQLKMEGGKKILKIYNTGVGIQKGEEEKIFERFYRSDASRSRQTGGYGLGLAIAKKIADQHHIKIQVLTEPNQWICFQLTL